MKKTLKLLELQPVAQNKTVIVYSPLDTPEILVRSGTPSLNSLYHAVLHCYSLSFIQKIDKREKMVQNLLSDLGKGEKKEDKEVKKYYQLFYDEINKSYLSPKSNTESLLFDLIPSYVYEEENFSEYLKDFDTPCNLNEPFSEAEKDYFCKYLFLILNRSLENVGDNSEKRKRFLQVELLKFIEDKISSSSLLYKRKRREEDEKKLEKKENNLEEELNGLSKRLKTNIFVLDPKDRLPIRESIFTKNYKKSIIILLLEENKFEPIGVLKEKNKVDRLFKNKDPIIEKILCFLKDKNKFLQKYESGKYLHSLVPKKRERKEKKGEKREKEKNKTGSKRRSRGKKNRKHNVHSSSKDSDSESDKSHSNSGSDSDSHSNSGSDRSDSIPSEEKSKTPRLSESKSSRSSHSENS